VDLTAAELVGARLRRHGAGVLLDLDGTLVDSEPTNRAAFATYFARRGWDVPHETLMRFAGRRGTEVLAELDGPWAGEDPVTLADEIVACLDPEATPPVPVPGAADAVAAWRRAGVPISLVTSARHDWAVEALEMLGVADLGLAMVTAESVAVGKPDPEPFLRGADALGLDPADCLAFEDAPAGLAAALGAGVGLVVGVRTSHPDAVLREAGAHASVPDMTALVPAVSGEART